MPYRIRREDGKYCLHNLDTGNRVPGSCHSSRSDTLRMLQAIEANLQGKSSDPLELTPTESVVARYVVAGLQNKQIALKMFVSVRTIDNHVNSILSKTGAGNRSALALSMLFRGFISMEDLSTLYEIGCQEGAVTLR